MDDDLCDLPHGELLARAFRYLDERNKARDLAELLAINVRSLRSANQSLHARCSQLEAGATRYNADGTVSRLLVVRMAANAVPDGESVHELRPTSMQFDRRWVDHDGEIREPNLSEFDQWSCDFRILLADKETAREGA